ncbi:TrmH family RNA methyltransferase [Glycomyces xiaoerkulensis]|uniref:TrmH family RNA methyltransferase n=1 Tax=Glycomyces xiaoerkulensis TaxID=2038139 RepID=UPI0018E4CDEB|nr:RNA methyltransferase [Glycomyces xiaoerkulensis]
MSYPVIAIDDPDDERLADYRALTDLALRTRFEPPNGLFIAEGRQVVERALRAGYRMRSMLIDAKRTDQLAGLAEDAPCYTAGPELLEAVTGFHVHRGTLASFHRRTLPEPAEILERTRRLVVLEGINNHTNIGAIFRVAAGLGFDGVLLAPDCADPLYRRSVRVSMGEVFAVPYTYLSPWPDGLKQIRDAGFALIGLSPSAEAIDISEVGAADRERPALMFGAEGPGLTGPALAACDTAAVIPMHAGVDSLNVAAATSVACWELSQPEPRVRRR